MMKLQLNYFMMAVLLLPLIGCGASQQSSETANPTPNEGVTIGATNAALASMTKAIVGDFAQVIRPRVQTDGKQGLDTEEVIRLQATDLVFTNGPGANDAAWLDLISLDPARVHATTSDEFELADFIQIEDYQTVHSHGDEGEHSHPWLVPYCWLNPRLAQAQSVSILNRLVREFPEQEDDFRERHRAQVDELNVVASLAEEVAELLESNNIRVIASDPRLLFFTRALKLEDKYLLWFDLPDASAAIADLRKRLPSDQGKSVLLWSQDAGSLKEKIGEAINVDMVRISLLEEADVEGGYVVALRNNFETVKAIVEGMND